MKVDVNDNKTITVHLEHVIDANDLAWAVVWQRFVMGNEAELSRHVIWRWAVDNIVEGRLYKIHSMSNAADRYMGEAMRLVNVLYPEFSLPPGPPGNSSSPIKVRGQRGPGLYVREYRAIGAELVPGFRALPDRSV